MSTRGLLCLLPLFLVAGFLVSGVPRATVQAAMAPQQSREPVLSTSEDTPALAKIRQKLADPVTLEFVETPLGDFLDFLKDFTGVNIVIHRTALTDEGVTSDTPFSIHVQSIKLSSALSLLLRPQHLTWVLQDDCLIITSQVVANNHIVTRSYPVGDLTATPEHGELLAALAKAVLESDGRQLPQDRMQFVDSLRAIVLTETLAAHDRLAGLLEQLRGGAEPSEPVKRIQAKLNDPVTLEFVETPLSDIVDFVKDFTGVNIVLDDPALEEEGVNADTPCTIHVESIALRMALTILLGQYNLTSRIEHECLVITSKLDDQTHFELRSYPVGKLLGERPKPSREEWLRLAVSVIGPELATANPARSPRVFPPGAQVRIRWAGTYFPATVTSLGESTYSVRFKFGDSEREETVAAQHVTDPTNRAPEPHLIVEYFEPRHSLVVLGPESLHRRVENLIDLVVKTAGRTSK